jgi:hypothetical protein
VRVESGAEEGKCIVECVGILANNRQSKATALIQAVTVDPLDLTTSVRKAAKAVVDIAISEEFAGSEGYFEGRQKVASSPDSLDKNVQRELWVRSLR